MNDPRRAPSKSGALLSPACLLVFAGSFLIGCAGTEATPRTPATTKESAEELSLTPKSSPNDEKKDGAAHGREEVERDPSCSAHRGRKAISRESGKASYYADSLAGNKTASGEPYEPTLLSAAHRTLPLGTLIRVTDPSSGKSTCVVVNDRGPHAKGRIVDLSRRAADELGLIRRGVAPVTLEVLELGPARRSRK